MPIPSIVRLVHRCSGVLLAAFAVPHLVNHALLAFDQAAAFAFMDGFRRIYRHGAVEPLLLAAALVQLGTGLALARRRGAGAAVRLSGYYLLFFLLVHVTAVAWGRFGLDVDTDIRFAAAGMRGWPARAFFIPYYFLAVVTVCLHAGLGIGQLLAVPRRAAVLASATAGVLAGAAIVGGLLAVAATPLR